MEHPLKKFRERLGYTQEEIGQAVGVSQTYISKFERGLATPELETARELSFLLSVNHFKLFPGLKEKVLEEKQRIEEVERGVLLTHHRTTRMHRDYSEDPIKKLLDEERRVIIRRGLLKAIRLLPKRIREVIRLRYGIENRGGMDEEWKGSELTLEEVGNKLGIAGRGAWTYENRGLETLRRLYTRENFEY